MVRPIIEINEVSVSYRSRRGLFGHSDQLALDRVNFWIRRGETLGVIGGNGSGKSTLLRLLAEIYRPDSGKINRDYRSVMLLSLAIGFLSELTGRENALLSGVLLGGSIKQVRRRLDDIIEFSGLGGYIDKPVKTYSSGMRARLGFSVAIEMEADLLLIDEVMSVGDQAFRKKAEAALAERVVSDQTVVLVSHSVNQVSNLCDRALWLERGSIRALGDAEEVCAEYKASG